MPMRLPRSMLPPLRRPSTWRTATATTTPASAAAARRGGLAPVPAPASAAAPAPVAGAPPGEGRGQEGGGLCEAVVRRWCGWLQQVHLSAHHAASKQAASPALLTPACSYLARQLAQRSMSNLYSTSCLPACPPAWRRERRYDDAPRRHDEGAPDYRAPPRGTDQPWRAGDWVRCT